MLRTEPGPIEAFGLNRPTVGSFTAGGAADTPTSAIDDTGHFRTYEDCLGGSAALTLVFDFSTARRKTLRTDSHTAISTGRQVYDDVASTAGNGAATCSGTAGSANDTEVVTATARTHICCLTECGAAAVFRVHRDRRKRFTTDLPRSEFYFTAFDGTGCSGEHVFGFLQPLEEGRFTLRLETRRRGRRDRNGR